MDSPSSPGSQQTPPAPAAVTPASAVSPPASSGIDRTRLAAYVKELRGNQNVGGALGGGFLGAVIGAIAWAVITVLTNFQIGWEAIGVGFLVGFGVRKLGRGIDPVFGYIGGILSLFGILAGNILTGVLLVARDQHIPIMDILMRLNLTAAWELLSAGFSPIDLLFYALGIYYGYRYSFHRLSAAEISSLRT